MSTFREVVFATMVVIGAFLLLNPIFIHYNPPDLMLLSVCFGIGFGAVGGLGLLAFTESASEYRTRAARQENLDKQAVLAHARNLETAGRFEEAAMVYERYGMFEDAGRVRSSKRGIRITGTVETGQTTVIKEKETIVKEVVMIPCKYCGGLMPQTSESCPNCGASRKRD